MKSLLVSAGAALLVFWAPAVPAAEPLTEPEVRAFLEECDGFVRQKQFDALAARFTPDARIRFSLPEGDSEVSPAEYADLLKQKYDVLPPETAINYFTQVNRLTIEGEEARVEALTFERVETETHIHTTVAEEHSRIRRQPDGRLRFVAAHGRLIEMSDPEALFIEILNSPPAD